MRRRLPFAWGEIVLFWLLWYEEKVWFVVAPLKRRRLLVEWGDVAPLKRRRLPVEWGESVLFGLL